MQEVIGSAIAIQLLTGGRVPLWQGVLITGIDTFFLLFLERLGVRKLEAFFGVLVATMTVSFGVMYSKAHCPTGEVLLGTLLPRIQCTPPLLDASGGCTFRGLCCFCAALLDSVECTTHSCSCKASTDLPGVLVRDDIRQMQLLSQPRHECRASQLSIAAGIVGALVMPHNIFLHSALVQSRKIDDSRVGANREAILYNAIESAVSLSITVMINLFVMSVFAAGFHDVGIEVGLSTAGECAHRGSSCYATRSMFSILFDYAVHINHG